MTQQAAPPPQRNLLVFFLLVTALLFGYMQFRDRIFPPAPKVEPDARVKEGGKVPPGTGSPRVPEPLAVTKESDLLQLGGEGFDLQVTLDPLGAGVRSVSLTVFRPASESGKPADGGVLELVPAAVNLHEPAFLLTHYEQKDMLQRPVETLGRREWQVVKQDGKAVVETAGDKKRQAVSFATEIDGVRITKTYTLVAGEYHVGLEVKMERAKSASAIREKENQPIKFRYQLTGGKGLPIEGKWYTSTFRNSLVALEDDKGYIGYRDFQELRSVSVGLGGNAVPKKDDRFIRYAGVANQYFASMIVVDETQKDQRFLRGAQPTLETGVLKGRVKPGSLDKGDRVVLVSDDGKTEYTAYMPRATKQTEKVHAQREDLREGVPVALIYTHAGYDDRLKESPRVIRQIRVGTDAEATHALWEDDITVRVSTEDVTLAPGAEVTHKYLLYHGPVKVALLGQLRGDRVVDDALVARYIDNLKLNTMTDYQSPGPAGTFSYTIGWTYVLVKCTNVMHWVLGKLTLLIPNYGLAIILLTLMVRAMMFPLSRKQAMMGLKMQALAPQLKALKEKHKDDKQAFAAEQMRIFRENGVNPFGSCWVLLLQMPIFMGLYFSLQESIQFRLAPFWPTWIANLAAPDMLLEWGKHIPLLSRDQDYGGLIYLGPYFNLLPLFAVAFMVMQQKMMTPPPVDRDQANQQFMMRIMMLFMGVFFYKMAAGLCLYIITSTIWGFTERKLLPKVKKLPEGTAPPTTEATAIALGAKPTNGVTLPMDSLRKAGKNRKKMGRPVKEEPAPEPTSGLGKLRRRLSDWWSDVLDQAKKK
jgi:YidC/Oxa1 family membrane protein insertase